MERTRYNPFIILWSTFPSYLFYLSIPVPWCTCFASCLRPFHICSDGSAKELILISLPWFSPILLQVAPQCEDFLLRCVWKGRVQESCSTLFKLHKTYEGYCCSFNYIGIKEEIQKCVYIPILKIYNSVLEVIIRYWIPFVLKTDKDTKKYAELS
jgi:hypothetical protein